MKILFAVFVTLLVGLQYRLWVGEGSLANIAQLSEQIDQQTQENNRLSSRNQQLAIEVDALRTGYDAIEAKAREELGLVKPNETFFFFIEK